MTGKSTRHQQRSEASKALSIETFNLLKKYCLLLARFQKT